MMQIRVKRTLTIGFLIICCVAAVIIGRSYLFNKVKSTVENKLRALDDKTDYEIRYDSIYIDWRRNLITIDHLTIQKDAYDTTCVYPEFISAQQVRIEGLGLWNFIVRKKLSIESVHIYKPHIVVREHSRLLPDTVTQRENEFTLTIENVRLAEAHLEFTDSASCRLITDFKSDINASLLAMDFHARKPLKFALAELLLDSTEVHLPKSFYSINIQKIKLNVTDSTLRIDTVKILPHLSKIEFGKKAKREIDRVEGVVPFVHFSGLDLRTRDTLTIAATAVRLQGFIKLFRDKRLRHLKIFKPMPIALLRQLPFGLSIDTMRITKSYVEYEEFPEEGKESGIVFFDDLNALIHSVTNDRRATKGKTMVMARASFMGQGDLNVTTTLPWNKNEKSITEGTLEGLDFKKLNTVLEPMANLKAESGDLKALTFRFTYNGIRSEGSIELNYNNLKLVAYKDEEKIKKQEKRRKRKNKDPEQLARDNFKTFILNAFVIKKNMDEKVPEERRTGTISFQRDTTRSIFNYWWKSVLSGIKSAYNIDQPKPRDKRTKKRNRKNKS
jgi:hypothetical protein